MRRFTSYLKWHSLVEAQRPDGKEKFGSTYKYFPVMFYTIKEYYLWRRIMYGGLLYARHTLGSLIKSGSGRKSWVNGYWCWLLLFTTKGQKSVKDKAGNNFGVMHYEQGAITIHIVHHHWRYKRHYISIFYLTALVLAFSLSESKKEASLLRMNWWEEESGIAKCHKSMEHHGGWNKAKQNKAKLAFL